MDDKGRYEKNARATVSVCMIVKNEEAVLEHCLKSISTFADELIVVDTGSVDNTRFIASKYTDHVYEYTWQDDFAAARNFSFSKATCDYIMWLDADHVLDDENLEKLLQLKDRLYEVNSVCFTYITPENGGVSIPFHMIMRRDERKWYGAVHERFPIKEPMLMSDIVLYHGREDRGPEKVIYSSIRNSRIMAKISDEEVKACFWLGVQCFVDFTLAKEPEKAKRMLLLAMSGKTDEYEQIRCFLQAGNNFMYCKCYKAALDIYSFCLAQLGKKITSCSEIKQLLLRIQKCSYILGNVRQAIEYNDQLLRLFPDSVSGIRNKIWYSKFVPVTVSVCLIVRDEEAVLERCLKNVSQFADELIVVDTGSVDRTRSIACRYTNLVYDYTWDYDFAAARNFSFSKATCDYIMWLDADDDMDGDTIERIQYLKAHMPPETDVVCFRYTSDVGSDGLIENWELLRDRLIRRAINPMWQYPIHEVIPLDASCNILYRSDISVIHRKVRENAKRRNINIFELKFQEGYELDNMSRSYYCRELCLDGNHEEAVRQFEILYESGSLFHIDGALPPYIYSMKKLHRYSALRECLQQYLKDYGGSEKVFCTLGDVLRREQRNEEAVEMYRRAQACQMDLSDLMAHCQDYYDFRPWLGMGKAYLNMGALQKAREALIKAREIYPDNIQTKILLLYIEREESRIKEKRA